MNNKKNKLIAKSNTNKISKYRNSILKVFKKKSDLIFFHSETGNKFYDIISVLLFSSNFYLKKNIYIVDRIGTFQNHSIIQIIKYLSFKKNIFFLTDSHQILKNYEKNNIPIKILPLFLQYSKFYKKIKFRENLNISLYVGPARNEKGFFEIPNILKKIKKIKKIKFDLNYSLDSKNIKNPKIQFLLNKISEFDVNIQKIEMTEKEYIKYFQNIDVLIMNYKSNSYKDERTSTIFLDAISNFVIPIVKKDTWMSSFISDNKILKKLIIKENHKILDVLNYVKKNKYNILNEIKSFRSKILSINNPKKLNNIFKINQRNNNYFNNFFYINKNFLIKKDNEIIVKNNFKLIKEYNFKNEPFNLVSLLNKILMTSEFVKIANSLKIFNENNVDGDLLNQENLKLGLFKLNITKKNHSVLKSNKTFAQFLLTNKDVNTIYTLIKI